MAHIIGIGAGGGDLGLVPRAQRVRLLPRRIGARHARRLAAQAAKGVDQLAVTGRIDQSAVVMLAVDLDQRLAHLTQELHADADVVDEGAAPAVGALHAPQDERLFSLDAVAGKQGEDRMGPGQIEDRRHLALGVALAHERGIAAAADGKREGIEQDRLAGAGLAG